MASVQDFQAHVGEELLGDRNVVLVEVFRVLPLEEQGRSRPDGGAWSIRELANGGNR